jgi:hypothetical protein
MKRFLKRSASIGLVILLTGVGLSQTPAPVAPRLLPQAQPPKSPTTAPNTPVGGPKLEAVAETKLLMVALLHPNYKGLDRLLRQRPDDAASWSFARGQALLIAESGNLLMLRPPRTQGQAAWFERAAELRSKATSLARTIAAKDFDGSRVGFVDLANTCNRCHQTFRVAVEIEPFAGNGP